ncbi:dihydrofolate reductase family protein [Rhodopirellula bahusiensis]|uniref:Deaminase n=1 Tax=Rhodopirellula bahusiensis TaxID=2014065 RepID=A0A2G1VZW5_9BACT|nr:dihydrofolate reductase family protein [Rhodopirellula bahusiensis]PHQ32261.1 deaminase [Rhodopirellula bahusiensis]
MSARACVFIATSLDQFIARSDGNLDWLDEANALVPPGEDCGYAEFMKSVDVLVMGRNTYEKVRTFGAWPYGETPVVVLSRNPIEFPDEMPAWVTHSAETPVELHRRLSKEGAQKLYIDGGLTIQRFLRAGLIDELVITVIPVLIGDGIPLFGSLPSDIRLTHRNTKAFDCGFVQSTYRVDSTERP